MRGVLASSLRFERNMRLCGVIGVLLVAGAGSSAVADEAIHYANTCLEQESGDVSGYVVIVSQAAPIPSISLSWSEGAMMLPVAAKIDDYDRMSGRLAFSVHAEDVGDFHFKGRIGPQRIEGIFTTPWRGSPEHVELEAQSSKVAFGPHTECR